MINLNANQTDITTTVQKADFFGGSGSNYIKKQSTTNLASNIEGTNVAINSTGITEDPGMSRQWVEEVVEDLDDKNKDVARLILTASIAPYQVDEKMLLSFRKTYPSDDDLLTALSWGSLTVARRIDSWLYAPFVN